MKNRNVIIKSLKVERPLKKGPTFIGGATSASWMRNKSDPFIEDDGFGSRSQGVISAAGPTSQTRLRLNVKRVDSRAELLEEEYNNCDDNTFDTSSVSSMEDDELSVNIWDNSELRLRGIDVETFCDFYGKKISFVQLFKLRSAYYTKSITPSAGEMFKGAEKIHRFGNRSLTLDQFLNEDKMYNILEMDLKNDRNAIRFGRFFAEVAESASLKKRQDKYDRYACNRRLSAEELASPALKRRAQVNNSQVSSRVESQSISAIGLSPRKGPPSSQTAADLRKSQMNLQQINELHRKERQTKQQFKWTTREDESPMRVNTNMSNNNKSPSFYMESRKQSQYSDVSEMNGEGFFTDRAKLSSPPLRSILQRSQIAKKTASTFSSSPSRNVSIRMHHQSPDSHQSSDNGQFRLQLKTVHQDHDEPQQFNLMRSSLKGGMKLMTGNDSNNKIQQKFYSTNVSPWKRENTQTITTTTNSIAAQFTQPSLNNFTSNANSMKKLLSSGSVSSKFITASGQESQGDSRLPSIGRHQHSSSMVSEQAPLPAPASSVVPTVKSNLKNTRLLNVGSMGSSQLIAAAKEGMNNQITSSLRQTQAQFTQQISQKREAFARTRKKNVSSFTPRQTDVGDEFYYSPVGAKDI